MPTVTINGLPAAGGTLSADDLVGIWDVGTGQMRKTSITSILTLLGSGNLRIAVGQSNFPAMLKPRPEPSVGFAPIVLIGEIRMIAPIGDPDILKGTFFAYAGTPGSTTAQCVLRNSAGGNEWFVTVDLDMGTPPTGFTIQQMLRWVSGLQTAIDPEFTLSWIALG